MGSNGRIVLPATLGATVVLVLVLAACGRGEGEVAAPEAPLTEAQQMPATPTWREVGPIVLESCAPCHAPGGAAPFSLTTYEQARERQAYIAAVLTDDTMPPWLPAEGCGSFVAPRRLTSSAKRKLLDWALGGAKGGGQEVPGGRVGRRGLDRIDLRLDIGGEYRRPPAPRETTEDDHFRCFLAATPAATDRFITGWDAVPTRRADVLEVRVFEMDEREGRAADAADAALGWSCDRGEVGPARRTLGIWTSGAGAAHLPAGVAVRAPASRALGVEVHYHRHDHLSAREPLRDRTEVHLQLADARGVERVAELVTVRVEDIAIPPLTFGHRLSSTLPIGVEGDVLAIQPRMHKLGRSLHAELVGPDGSPTCLVDIPRWDYHREELFVLRGAVDARRSSVALGCTWENPTDRTIEGGPRFDDEACELSLLVARPRLLSR